MSANDDLITNESAIDAAKARAKAIAKLKGFRNQVVSAGWLGYARHGASDSPESSLCAWFAPGGRPKADVDDNLPRLRARARDLKMGSSLISAVLDAKRKGVVGRGIHLDPQLDADCVGLSDEEASAIERRIQHAWRRWEKRAGIGGESLAQVLDLAYFSQILSGDSFVRVLIGPDGLKLGVIEGDSVRTPPDKLNDPRVAYGVEFSPYRDYPIAYYVGRYRPDDATYSSPLSFIRTPSARPGYQDLNGAWVPPRSGLLHVRGALERPGQVRGVPLCAPMMEDLKQLDRYVSAELDAAVVSSKFTAFVKHPQEEVEDFGAFGVKRDIEEAMPTGYPPEQPMMLGNGAIVDLDDGADVTLANPTRPNPAFGGFVDSMQERICAALGVPVEVAVKRFNASYSASRAALLDADKSYSIDRARLINQVLEPVYAIWLDVNAERLGLAGYYTSRDARECLRQAEWIGEQIPSIDPEKEVSAARARIEINASTEAREARELTGTDVASNIRQRGFEERLSRANGLVKDQNGKPIQ